jgi:hypothetical protein
MKKIEELLDRTPGGILYHYTNASGLLGILDGGKIWASSAYHMNDTGEFRYALGMIEGRIHNYIKHVNGPNNELYGKLLEAIGEVYGTLQVYVNGLAIRVPRTAMRLDCPLCTSTQHGRVASCLCHAFTKRKNNISWLGP